MSMTTTGWLSYNLGYLLLYPTANCVDSITGVKIDEKDCEPQWYCNPDNHITYKIDDNSDMTLTNWIDDFDLLCASKLEISSFGMLFFSGFTIGSMILPQYGDIYGRKIPFYICLTV